jgi:hypothetical protein
MLCMHLLRANLTPLSLQRVYYNGSALAVSYPDAPGQPREPLSSGYSSHGRRQIHSGFVYGGSLYNDETY